MVTGFSLTDSIKRPGLGALTTFMSKYNALFQKRQRSQGYLFQYQVVNRAGHLPLSPRAFYVESPGEKSKKGRSTECTQVRILELRADWPPKRFQSHRKTLKCIRKKERSGPSSHEGRGSGNSESPQPSPLLCKRLPWWPAETVLSVSFAECVKFPFSQGPRWLTRWNTTTKEVHFYLALVTR